MFFFTLMTQSWPLNLMRIYNIMLMPGWFLWQKKVHCKHNIHINLSTSWSNGFLYLGVDIYMHKRPLLYENTIPIINSLEHPRTIPPNTLLGAPYPSMAIWHHVHCCPQVQCSHISSRAPHVHVNTNRVSTSHDVITNWDKQSLYPTQDYSNWSGDTTWDGTTIIPNNEPHLLGVNNDMP